MDYLRGEQRVKGYVGPLSNYWRGGASSTPMSPLLNYDIASPILSLPPLDPARWSNLVGPFMLFVDTFCVKKVNSSNNN